MNANAAAVEKTESEAGQEHERPTAAAPISGPPTVIWPEKRDLQQYADLHRGLFGGGPDLQLC